MQRRFTPPTYRSSGTPDLGLCHIEPAPGAPFVSAEDLCRIHAQMVLASSQKALDHARPVRALSCRNRRP